MTDHDAAQDERGLRDPSVRSKFGFDADDESWLERCRVSSQGPPHGRLGTYELLGDAGRGAQGYVYKALQPGTGRVIAIKQLGAGRFATPRMRERFELEIVALSALSHPGVVTVFGVDEVEGQRVLLMEWIDGAPIDLWARSRDVRERLRVFALVCDAVTHAHQRGIIHRDLKPSNILVDRADAPHVLDFGLARLLQSDLGPELSRTEWFVGTPAYAAPEQLTGPRDIDTRTDVYALGAVLYELMTGALPLEPLGDLGAMVDAIRTTDPQKPSERNRDLGSELDAIATKALAKERQQRYQSVAELGDDVRRFLAGEAVLAHPPSRAYRARKFVRRHRRGVVGAAVCVLALLIGAAATAWQAVRATSAEVQTALERDTARREARRADAVRDFFTTLLAKAGPQSGESSQMTVRAALVRASTELDAKSLATEPEVEDAIRFTLGTTFASLLGRAEAAKQFEWVAHHRERTLGSLSPALADVLYKWGNELGGAGRTAQAKQVLLRSIEIYRASGPGKWNRLHPLLVLAALERQGGNAAEALPRYLELVAEFQRTNANNGELEWALYGLAQTYRDLGRANECVATFESARPLVERTFPRTYRVHIWFAIDYCLNVCEPSGRHEETARVLSPVVEAALDACGPSDPDVGRLVSMLSHALLELGRGPEAEPLLRKLVAAREQTSKPDDEQLLVARSLLGSAMAQAGRTEEAEAHLVASFEALDSARPNSRAQRDRALQRVIRLYEGLGREDQAALFRARQQ